jgi:hypothetical protein
MPPRPQFSLERSIELVQGSCKEPLDAPLTDAEQCCDIADQQSPARAHREDISLKGL